MSTAKCPLTTAGAPQWWEELVSLTEDRLRDRSAQQLHARTHRARWDLRVDRGSRPRGLGHAAWVAKPAVRQTGSKNSYSSPVEQLLADLGFTMIGEVVDHQMQYRPEATEIAGSGGAVYVFVNPDGRAWKVGMTRKGFSRVDYSRVLDGRAMKRPHEQRKLKSIRLEVRNGATQWVLRTDQPELIETLLACLLDPTESGRQRSAREAALRRFAVDH